MSRHIVIGTAGHVDHGKSALVLALTGTDPDRWAEEKRRGITMDLGFALLALNDQLAASIVDVPGHEDFVRNMVAGATGVDVALLVVAADEGVMPQTLEHLAILDFLGVRSGVVALSKADLAEPEWLALVRDDLATRLQHHATTWHAIIPVSATREQGLDDLRAALSGAADTARARREDDLFRLPVDRVFSVAGAGTVVTGTVWSGSLRVGDTVRVLPADVEARVRSVEVHGTSTESALPGRRTALALAGLPRDAAERGAVVVTDPTWRCTEAMDVVVRMVPGAKLLGQRSRVRVHLGTAEVLARVTPGEGDVVRLRLEQPLVARWGDRGVLRSYSPVTTIGGFTVCDPWPAARPRRPSGGLRGDDRLAVAVRAAGDAGFPASHRAVRLAVGEGMPDGVVQLGDRLVAVERIEAAVAAVRAALTQHHAKQPESPGVGREALRQVIGVLTDAAVARLVAAGVVEEEGVSVRLAEHSATLSPADRAAADALLSALDAARFEGLDRTGVDQRLAEFLVRAGQVVRLGRERYYLSAHRDAMVAIARDLLRTGDVSPAVFRERLGISRKYLMPFLEWLDQEGYSVRSGDGRRAGHRLEYM